MTDRDEEAGRAAQAPSEADCDRLVAGFRAMPREELLAELERYQYFHLDLGRWAVPPRPGRSLRSTEVVADLLRAAASGDLGDQAIGALLTRLAAAERELGYRGRPMLMDFDCQLTAMLRALRRT